MLSNLHYSYTLLNDTLKPCMTIVCFIFFTSYEPQGTCKKDMCSPFDAAASVSTPVWVQTLITVPSSKPSINILLFATTKYFKFWLIISENLLSFFFLPQLLCLCAYFSFLTLFIHQRYDLLVTPLLQRVNWCAKFPWLLPLLIWFMKPVDIIWFWRIMKEMSH